MSERHVEVITARRPYSPSSSFILSPFHSSASLCSPRQLTLTGVSDNVGGVKHFSSTLQHALREERHFALMDGVAFPTVGSLVIVSRSGTQSDPCISSVTTSIMITTSNSSAKRSGLPNQ